VRGAQPEQDAEKARSATSHSKEGAAWGAPGEVRGFAVGKSDEMQVRCVGSARRRATSLGARSGGDAARPQSRSTSATSGVKMNRAQQLRSQAIQRQFGFGWWFMHIRFLYSSLLVI